MACWQDKRHTLSPIGWDTILLLLEGESVQTAVKGGASVTVETPPPFIITAQEKIIPLSSKGVPDQAEAEAFQNRFCLRWHLRKALPKSQQDPQMKLAMRCGSCYSKWIDRNAAAYKLRAPDMEEQVIEMERAIQGEPAQLEQPARLPIEVSAAEHQCLLTPCFFVRQKFCAPIFRARPCDSSGHGSVHDWRGGRFFSCSKSRMPFDPESKHGCSGSWALDPRWIAACGHSSQPWAWLVRSDTSFQETPSIRHCAARW